MPVGFFLVSHDAMSYIGAPIFYIHKIDNFFQGKSEIFQKLEKSTTVSPRIARIQIVRIHYSTILFLVQKYSNSAIPRNSAITKAKNGIQIV